MSTQNKDIGFYPADVLLPEDADYKRWGVVACDQFTSDPKYWQDVADEVGDAPSALNLILPEAQLKSADVQKHIGKINSCMEDYLSQGIFKEYKDAMIYLERVQSDGCIRRGIIGKIDLEDYDYTPGSKSLIRATEGTVLERIPPRVAVRKDAALELPHVMMLIDDPGKTVIEPLIGKCSKELYNTELMQGGGRARAWLLSEDQKKEVSRALGALAGAADFPLLFAVGDGNHSLATAKTCYENLKRQIGPAAAQNHPARYALAEVVNLHDEALKFEPIHRVLFNADPKAVIEALLAYYPGSFIGQGEGHTIRYVYEKEEGCITIPSPKLQLAVGTLQEFLDFYLKTHNVEIDYIHGDEECAELGKKPGNLAFILSAMAKSELFPTVVNDGVLPRKTFSMGHARDKRYYIEARKIK